MCLSVRLSQISLIQTILTADLKPSRASHLLSRLSIGKEEKRYSVLLHVRVNGIIWLAIHLLLRALVATGYQMLVAGS